MEVVERRERVRRERRIVALHRPQRSQQSGDDVRAGVVIPDPLALGH